VWALRRFRLFWTGDTISAAGGALSAVALPLLALSVLHATDLEIGVLRAAQTLPFLLFAIPIGLLADRVSRRRLLLAADAVRFPLTAVIALAGASLPFGGGFLLGALVRPAAARRAGAGRVVIAASLIGASGIGLVALSGGLPLVLLGSALAGAGSGLFNLHAIAIRQAITPPRLLGRVNAVVKTISYGSTTAGAFAGGVAAAAFGARAVIAAAALSSAVATTCLLTPAIRTLTALPIRPAASDGTASDSLAHGRPRP